MWRKKIIREKSYGFGFYFFEKNDLYKKCLYASIAHAVMTGKYPLLSDEIAWDGKNYLFQNMQGVRGVIAFYESGFVCSILNEKGYIAGHDKVIHNKLLIHTFSRRSYYAVDVNTEAP